MPVIEAGQGRCGSCQALSPSPEGKVYHGPQYSCTMYYKGKKGHITTNKSKWEQYKIVPRKPEPDKTYVLSTGWLARNGDFYACRGWEHAYTARSLGHYGIPSQDADERDLEVAGWIRLYDNLIAFPQNMYDKPRDLKPTQAQMDTLFDIMSKHGKLDMYKRFSELYYETSS